MQDNAIEQLDEHTLVSLLRTHPDDTLDRVFSTFRARLRRKIALRLDKRLLSRIDPSDVIQETYLEASRQLNRYLVNPTIPFRDWLVCIALRKTNDAFRHHAKTQKRSVQREQSVVDNQAQSFSVLAADEDRSELLNVVNRLSEGDRVVIQLRYFDEKTISEIANVLGISEDAATKRIHRAKARLQEMILRLQE